MKDIPGFEGLYAITEDGRIWSYTNSFFRKAYKREDGYLTAVLSKGKARAYRINRLVAMTYLENPNNHPVVRHLDNNPLNNHISNLEWCTQKTNLQQAWDEGRHKASEKQRNAARKSGLNTGKKVMQLTKEYILCKIYASCAEASRMTGFADSNICSCALMRKGCNTCGGYYWKFI